MAFTDVFVGTTGDLLASRAGWAQVDGLSGSAKIGNSNTLQCLSGTPDSSYQCTDQGSADHYTQVAWLTSRDGGFACVRLTDASNFIGFRHQTTGAKWTVYKRSGGVFTLLGQVVQALVSGDIGRLEIVGDEWSFYVNGVLKLGPATEVFNTTETRQGLSVRSVNANPWIDDFEAGSLSTGPATHALEGAAVAEASATGTLPVSADLSGSAAAAAAAAASLMLNGVFADEPFAYADNTSLASASPDLWYKTLAWGNKNLGVSGQKVYGSETGLGAVHAYRIKPPDADYSVSADFTASSSAGGFGNSRAGVAGRMPDNTQYYLASYDGSEGAITMDRYSLFGGGLTRAGTHLYTLAAGQTVNIRLEMIGADLAVYLDGSATPVLTYTDPSPLTLAGEVGVFGYTETLGQWTADNFKAQLADTGAAAVDLAGAAAAQAAATAALSVSVPLAAAGLSVSTATGALSVTVPNVDLSGNATATASAQGGLSLSIPLAGSAVAQALAQAGITVAKDLSGAAIAEALASADLGIVGSVDLSGAAIAQAVASAALAHGVPLAGDAIAAAVSSAGLSNGISLAGSGTSEAFAGAGLAIAKALAGSAAATSTASGGLSINVSLSGTAIAQAAAMAGLTVLNGASLAGDAAASASASGTLTHAIPLSGASLVVSSASGHLSQIVPLYGSAASASMATGGLDVSVQLSGAALAQAMAAGGITHVIAAMLAGSASGDASASGSLTLRINLDGGALAQAIASGALTAQGLLYGATPGWSISVARRNWAFGQTRREWRTAVPRRNWMFEQTRREWRIVPPARNWRFSA